MGLQLGRELIIIINSFQFFTPGVWSLLDLFIPY